MEQVIVHIPQGPSCSSRLDVKHTRQLSLCSSIHRLLKLLQVILEDTASTETPKAAWQGLSVTESFCAISLLLRCMKEYLHLYASACQHAP